MEEKTKVQQLVEIANWAKKQNGDFMKHFLSMRGIIKFYLQLPSDYDRSKSVVEYIRNGLKTKKQSCERLALISHSLFGCPYFKGAPAMNLLSFGLRKNKGRDGVINYEVYMSRYERCSSYNKFEGQSYGTCSVRIKSLLDAKAAAEKLLEDFVKKHGNDNELKYGNELLKAMKESSPTGSPLEIGIDVYL